MAGHSHSANVKYRKDRQDEVKSKLFLKLRKKIESVIKEEGEVNEKSLSIARENQFPKEKVYQIWEKIKENKETFFSRNLYQGPFGILLYLEGDSNEEIEELAKSFKLKKLPLSSLYNYFQLIYSLKISPKRASENLEKYLLISLPNNIWEKVNFDEKNRELSSWYKEDINTMKNIIKSNSVLIIEEEKNFWKPLTPYSLTQQEEINYYAKLEQELIGKKFYTNIETGL
jgi:transcriptional/translational regulatory protein YebC/TACO1